MEGTIEWSGSHREHQDKVLPLNSGCVAVRVSWAAGEMPLPRSCPKYIKSLTLAIGVLYFKLFMTLLSIRETHKSWLCLFSCNPQPSQDLECSWCPHKLPCDLSCSTVAPFCHRKRWFSTRSTSRGLLGNVQRRFWLSQ